MSSQPLNSAPHPWVGCRIPDMLERSADTWPDNIAIIDGSAQITYACLRDHMHAAAARLEEAGVASGDHVAIFLPETWRHVALLYGILHLGAVIVPMNLTWEGAEIERALRDSDSSYLITGLKHRGQDLLPRLQQAGIARTAYRPSSRYPRLRHVIWDAPGRSNGERSLEDLFEQGLKRRPQGTTQLGFLMFTSGSSASPKAAMIEQVPAMGCAYFNAQRMAINVNDRALNVLPLYHCGGLINVLLACHQAGAAVQLFEDPQIDGVVRSMWENQSSLLVSFDVVTSRVVAAGLKKHGRLPLKRIISSPGVATFDYFTSLGLDHAIIYALTEASNLVSVTSERDGSQMRRDSNGFPLPGVQVRICDSENGQTLGAGESGEICFKGWNLMKGYYRSGQLPQLTLDNDGYFHTGDYGFLDIDGRLYYRGRFSAMVKTGGENVSQLEVENFLMSHIDGVRQAAVIGVPDDRWGEAVVAFVETIDGRSITSAELREQCRGRLAKFKIPKTVYNVEEGGWPVTPTGKILKNKLVALATSG